MPGSPGLPTNEEDNQPSACGSGFLQDARPPTCLVRLCPLGAEYSPLSARGAAWWRASHTAICTVNHSWRCHWRRRRSLQRLAAPHPASSPWLPMTTSRGLPKVRHKTVTLRKRSCGGGGGGGGVVVVFFVRQNQNDRSRQLRIPQLIQHLTRYTNRQCDRASAQTEEMAGCGRHSPNLLAGRLVAHVSFVESHRLRSP